MKYPDFSKCYTKASLALPEYPSGKLCYGLFTPLTDKKTWDERWIKDGAKSFLHWWVETDTHIIDAGSRQFGGGFMEMIPLSDKRYQKVGYEIGGIRNSITDEISIVWNTLEDGKTVSIKWPNYQKYLNSLRGIR